MALIFDADDFHETNHRLDLLQQLKDANPAFKMTAFAVPAYCPGYFIESLPDWIELVPHGWHHGGPHCDNPYEAANWDYDMAMNTLLSVPDGFVEGWKSPGWQVSDGTYKALLELGWWVADHPMNDSRRPAGLRVHRVGDGDHCHTHVQDVCGNGLAETFGSLIERVRNATDFQFVSEVVK